LQDLRGQQPADDVAIRQLENDPTEWRDFATLARAPYCANLESVLGDYVLVCRFADGVGQAVELSIFHERSGGCIQSKLSTDRGVDKGSYFFGRCAVSRTIHKAGP
jgi:hypothetical protein